MAKTISLEFDGYWREVNKESIPNRSGIYAVYVCEYNKPQKEGEKGTVTLTKLIYIGEAEKVNERIVNHDKWEEWRKQVPSGSEICFSFAEVISPDRERAECALIYYHKPKCNDECKDSFSYEETTVTSKGQTALITSPITMKTTPT